MTAGTTATANEHALREPAANRFMRRLLRAQVQERTEESDRAAHRNFRLALIVTGIRCIISYLVIPIAVPIISFASVVAAPVGILLCAVAVVNGIASVRRFWITDHRSKWMYTGFMAVVFVILAIALWSDVTKIVTGA